MPFEFADPMPQLQADSAAKDELWLLGQPPLSDYLAVVTRDTVGTAPRRADIIAEWRKANDHLGDLEKREAGLADRIRCRKLPKDVRPLAQELRQQDIFRDTFDRVETSIEMVELDRIVASQRHVTLPFVQSLAARLDPAMSGGDLFRFCQPLERRDAAVECRKVGRDRYAFVSDSNDLRYHETMLLRADQVSGLHKTGPVAGVVGIIVGHGSNFLSGIRWGKRIVLHNGYHRATALRMAGFTHAPIIVQTVSRRDELDTVAASAVVDDPAFYFRANRPPMLKDFFDERLSVVLPVRRKRKMIEVSYTITEIDIDDL
ncbi:hypothetical protein [Paracoccus laeviglucosivorans]|uniref:Uncharacterized protein n=1 Tax=Paracoccus laeviglucosivorans TaxID=1197861 RepID=A0A521ESF6_9RHOB|nr:hypothetical protein [Paracoccus laeviglucosivorans]SMO86030.1 hypothetical protein SAMN06265221_11492 [Paracoccus laeviglucosivorans]